MAGRWPPTDRKLNERRSRSNSTIITCYLSSRRMSIPSANSISLPPRVLHSTPTTRCVARCLFYLDPVSGTSETLVQTIGSVQPPPAFRAAFQFNPMYGVYTIPYNESHCSEVDPFLLPVTSHAALPPKPYQPGEICGKRNMKSNSNSNSNRFRKEEKKKKRQRC